MSDTLPFPPDADPSRYVEKISLTSGEVLSGPIRPEQLLVSSHRDYHVMDVQARMLMGMLVDATGDEDAVVGAMRNVRQVGSRARDLFGKVVGDKAANTLGKALAGFKEKEYYFRFKHHALAREEIDSRLAALRREAAIRLAAVTVGDAPRLRVLLTGGTGFVGKEVMWQAAHDDAIVEMVVVIRPRTVRDRDTGEVVKVLSPSDRGERLMRQLWLTPEQQRKFRFVAGDVEQADLGIASEDMEMLKVSITHVIHAAASVSFDSPYPTSFSANVSGALNALNFSHHLQNAPGSPFVAHLSIETSYIHGRQVRELAREDEVVFPRNFYNNYYELTKAMASIETERFMLQHGLRVVQLCPAIVIGEGRTGNNRGDRKVVNAPVNVFGRAGQAVKEIEDAVGKSKAWAVAKLACVFPGDPGAELNLIPVDRVVEGIIAALKAPAAVGERVHLASDNRISSGQIRDIVKEEIGVKVTLSEPTRFRNVTMPVMGRVLRGLGQERVAEGLEKLGSIFGGYAEWGQPVHEVGKDVAVLGLSDQRPNVEHAFRMLCRHNRYVQEYGKVRDDDEVSRREKVWREFCLAMEDLYETPAGAIAPHVFHREVRHHLNLKTFEWN
jgi:nucleoside-diphosphate-sugar epimerase